MNRTNRLLLAATTIALTASACSAANAARSATDSPDSDGVTVNNSTDRALVDPVINGTLVLPDGWYELTGYGTVLLVGGDEVTPHYVTTSTCVIGDSFDNELAVDHASGDGVITVDLVGPTTDYQLRPLLGGLTCDCSEADTVQAFDELFTTHYPFFTERGINWDHELAAIRAVTEADAGRFDETLVPFLAELGDGHTTLDGLDIDPDVAAFGLDDVDTIAELESAIGDEFDATIARIEGMQTDPSGTIGWGKVTDEVGYLFIGGFEGLTGEDGPVGDRDALVAAMDPAIADLNGRNYEAVGVPVDVVVPFDQALDAAIDHHRSGTPTS